jgi:hypothetical protein
MLINENLARSDSDSTESETDLRLAQLKETFNYVDVMAMRLNDVDHRLFKVAIDMNLVNG